eukprot:TRINITY_DN4328_c0_g1_i1.p1 TRINITY_DN4328_c0_g1~~TRINITY_DN4328_c0_g1_i1.p1  ORF type:complete len:361 (-),score=81.21 TRINITY_DN4328_c0_g1_i1:788-1870(-)
MSHICIGKEDFDPTYRYKMVKPVAKPAGRSTIMANLKQVAKDLGRPQDYILMYIGAEMGKKATWDGEYGEIRCTVSRHTMLHLLKKFIAAYVLCPKCKQPETDLVIEADHLMHECRGCGASSPAEMRHRVAEYMMKHPMPRAHSTGVCAMHRVDPSELVFLERQRSADDDNWLLDTSPEAARARALAAAGDSQVTVISPVDVTEPEQDVAEAIKAVHAAAQSMTDVKQLIKAVTDIDQRFDIQDALPGVVFEALFAYDDMGARAKKYAVVLSAVVPAEDHSAQRLVLGCMERACAAHTTAISQVALVLKYLYDEDVLEEKVIRHWYKRKTSKYVVAEVAAAVRNAAQPMMDWLSTAEEEE